VKKTIQKKIFFSDENQILTISKGEGGATI
jgi:hypothetical protein